MAFAYLFLIIQLLSISNEASTTVTPNAAYILAKLSTDKSDRICQQSLQRGNCSQKLLYYYYDDSDNKCRRFIYSGCNGNDNRFVTRRECESKCVKKREIYRKHQTFASLPPICKQKFDPKNQKFCYKSMYNRKIRFFYDIDENKCRPFWHNGCEGIGRQQSVFANEHSCKSLCVRKRHRKLFDMRRRENIKEMNRKACFIKFDVNLQYPCSSSSNWRLRYFYNQTSTKCDVFWYDISCSKRKYLTNMFKHYNDCKQLCQRANRMHTNLAKHHRIGQISAMFSEFKDSSTQAFRSKHNSSFTNISNDLRGVFRKLTSKTNTTRASVIGIIPKKVALTVEKSYTNFTKTFPTCKTAIINFLNVSVQSIVLPSQLNAYLIRVNETDSDKMDDLLGKDNDNFEFHISKAEFRRSLNDGWRANENKNNTGYNNFLKIFSKFSECGEFDSKLADACETVDWTPRYYFDRESGQCRMFWSSGCTSESANNFRNLSSCQERCEQRQSELRAHPSHSSKEETFPSDSPSRCLKPKESGKCSETYPAYYYNLEIHRCEPFVYSGCGGNSNRFLTLRQCQSVCSKFSGLSPLEANCFLPLDGGDELIEERCEQEAGIRYYFDQNHGRCERFWYSGCGGNENRFYDLVTCESVCRAVMTTTFSSNALHPKVCFQPIQKGKCMNKTRRSVQRWAYDHVKLRCVTFDYAGCNGNENRFATEFACNMNCKGLKLPLNERCMNYPNWGYCNHLNYRWFYNLTKGTCQQFLWGGCDDGNENRFETFEICQQSCEIPTENVCMEPLDRGHWCEPMSSRYYYNIDSKLCKGFHYTGCGNSRNIFMTKQECQKKCVTQSLPSLSMPFNLNSSPELKYKGVKPPEKHVVVVHKVLNAASIPNLKTDDQWMEYGQCVGFRYNISGAKTRLTSYLCSMGKNGSCHSHATLTSTDGDEKCFLVHPWLKGLHLYSWFFTIDQRPDIISKQSLNQTTAALIILPPNDCHSIC